MLRALFGADLNLACPRPRTFPRSTASGEHTCTSARPCSLKLWSSFRGPASPGSCIAAIVVKMSRFLQQPVRTARTRQCRISLSLNSVRLNEYLDTGPVRRPMPMRCSAQRPSFRYSSGGSFQARLGPDPQGQLLRVQVLHGPRQTEIVSRHVVVAHRQE
jgi:hypothetical protein